MNIMGFSPIGPGAANYQSDKATRGCPLTFLPMAEGGGNPGVWQQQNQNLLQRRKQK
jgi:hypothetical protein